MEGQLHGRAFRDFDSYLFDEIDLAVTEVKVKLTQPIEKALPWLKCAQGSQQEKDTIETFFSFCLSKLSGSKWTDFDAELLRHKKRLPDGFPTTSAKLKEEMEKFSAFFVRKIPIHYCAKGTRFFFLSLAKFFLFT